MYAFIFIPSLSSLSRSLHVALGLTLCLLPAIWLGEFCLVFSSFNTPASHSGTAALQFLCCTTSSATGCWFLGHAVCRCSELTGASPRSISIVTRKTTFTFTVNSDYSFHKLYVLIKMLISKYLSYPPLDWSIPRHASRFDVQDNLLSTWSLTVLPERLWLKAACMTLSCSPPPSFAPPCSLWWPRRCNEAHCDPSGRRCWHLHG